jgi:hypothetical protein
LLTFTCSWTSKSKYAVLSQSWDICLVPMQHI